METYKKQKKIVANYVFFCSSTMLTLKIITEIIFWVLNFLGSGIAALNLFQVDLDKP